MTQPRVVLLRAIQKLYFCSAMGCSVYRFANRALSYGGGCKILRVLPQKVVSLQFRSFIPGQTALRVPGQDLLPMPLLVLLVCWLTFIFFSFGLFTSLILELD
jgi:hypothetical protein